MPQLILLLFVAAIVVCLIAVVAIALFACLLWLLGAAVIHTCVAFGLGMFFLRSKSLQSLSIKTTTSDGIAWKANSATIDRACQPHVCAFFGTLASIPVFVYGAPRIVETIQHSSDDKFQEVALVLAAPLCIVAMGFLWHYSAKGMCVFFRNDVNRILESANQQLRKVKHLTALEAQTSGIAQALVAVFPVDYHSEAEAYVASHHTELASCSQARSELATIISKAEALAEKEQTDLEKAIAAHDEAMLKIKTVAPTVLDSGIFSLYEYLEELRNGLSHPHILNLVSLRKFSAFHAELSSALEEVTKIEKMAIAGDAGSDSSQSPPQTHVSLDLYYGLLGLKPGTTKEEIRKKKLKLNKLLNEDQNNKENTPEANEKRAIAVEHLKEINHAADVLLKQFG